MQVRAGEQAFGAICSQWRVSSQIDCFDRCCYNAHLSYMAQAMYVAPGRCRQHWVFWGGQWPSKTEALCWLRCSRHLFEISIIATPQCHWTIRSTQGNSGQVVQGKQTNSATVSIGFLLLSNKQMDRFLKQSTTRLNERQTCDMNLGSMLARPLLLLLRPSLRSPGGPAKCTVQSWIHWIYWICKWYSIWYNVLYIWSPRGPWKVEHIEYEIYHIFGAWMFKRWSG